MARQGNGAQQRLLGPTRGTGRLAFTGGRWPRRLGGPGPLTALSPPRAHGLILQWGNQEVTCLRPQSWHVAEPWHDQAAAAEARGLHRPCLFLTIRRLLDELGDWPTAQRQLRGVLSLLLHPG